MITAMHPPVLHDSSREEPVAPRPRILASLVAEAATPVRPLVHLGILEAPEGDNTGAPITEYALGVCHRDHVLWNRLGTLDLRTIQTERALLAGLSAFAMRHVREAQVQIGDAVIVLGDDPWSLLLLQWARLQGASPLVFAGRAPQSLGEHASSLGIDAALAELTPGELARAVKLTHRAAGFAVALDAIASEKSISQALAALRDGGRYVLAGIHPQDHVLLNVYPDLHRRDLEIVSAKPPACREEFASDFQFSLDLAAKGRLRFDGLLEPECGWRIVVV
jgi:threonine dehydrogenase-like Zn-dependent dehydrogenase